MHACVESPEGGGEGDGASYDEYGYGGGGGDDYGGYRGYAAHADPEIDPAKFLVEGVCMLVSVLCHCATGGQGVGADIISWCGGPCVLGPQMERAGWT